MVRLLLDKGRHAQWGLLPMDSRIAGGFERTGVKTLFARRTLQRLIAIFMGAPKKPKQKAWKDRVPACFGNADLKFASHPADEKRAKDMIREALGSGVSNHEILNAIRGYLSVQGANREHIEEQAAHARKLIGL
jgi:hypothetical protein